MHVDVEISKLEDNGMQTSTALITIENDGKLPKRIHYAALIIGPESEDLHLVVSRLFDKAVVKNRRDAILTIYKARLLGPSYSTDGKGAVIPLPYFFSEQIQLGNERVRYRCSIDTSKLQNAQFLTVRAIIFIRYKIGFIRWRTSSDLLVTNSSKSAFNRR